MPFRNLRRSPRRTVLTIGGIAAALCVLMGFLGIMDSVFGAVDTAESEFAGDNPDRIAVVLDNFYPIASPQIAAVAEAASVERAEPALRLPGSLASPAGEFEAFIDVVDFGGMWRPSLTDGEVGAGVGVVLSEKAAADLEVAVGDVVTLRHPVREGLAYRFVESDLEVDALHPSPLRGVVYVAMEHAGLFNLEGIANTANVIPASGVVTTDVQRELFDLQAIASVQSVTAVTDAVRDAFGQILAVVQVMVFAVLLLALLIAFNTAAINLEARAREHATMFAFGVKMRTALRMAMTESLVVGVVATIIGVAGGLSMVWWMTSRLLAETLPEFALPLVLRTETLLFVVIMGVIAVTLAPLLTVRRMRRMDLPGTLRLME